MEWREKLNGFEMLRVRYFEMIEWLDLNSNHFNILHSILDICVQYTFSTIFHVYIYLQMLTKYSL
jgi:hypothetical protein